jgi:hypothetical protein
MLERLHPEVRILPRAEGATKEALAALTARCPGLPESFLRLFAEATELELSYRGICLRLYGPTGCLEMDEAYSISRSVPGAITVGDNGDADPDHSEGERREILIGHSSEERLLLVSFTDTEGRIRMISARRATRRERRKHEGSK